MTKDYALITLFYVGQQDLKTIFFKAREKLILDFDSSKVTFRVKQAKLTIASSGEMARSLGGKSLYSTPYVSAFYNPNNHRVYLNSDLLSRVDQQMLLNICYHELLHAATRHRTYDRKDSHVFQSGVKIEIFNQDGHYTCLNRAFNEGIIELLSSQHNCINQGAYHREVQLMEKVAKDLGMEILKEAVLNAKVSRLRQRFNQFYGRRAFERFSRCLDKKKYVQAGKIIEKPQLKETWVLQPLLGENSI